MTHSTTISTFFDDDDSITRIKSEFEMEGFDTEQELVDANYNGAPPVYEENK